MQEYFNTLADHATSRVRGAERLTCHFQGEESDFVRINGARYRQPGHVQQRTLSVRLIDGQRHATEQISLSGRADEDQQRVDVAVTALRDLLPHIPEDPHLLIAEEVHNSVRLDDNKLPVAADAVDAALEAADGADLVGLYAGGGIHVGFANSHGQRNWMSSYSFNLDFSLYLRADKAVKSGYAGFDWSDEDLGQRMVAARNELAILARPSRRLERGRYRVYLSPVAIRELLQLLSWDSFGLKHVRTCQSALLRLAEGKDKLHPAFHLSENSGDGVAAGFSVDGFVRPGSIDLIRDGLHAGALISARSAQEYGEATNGTSAEETPDSLELAAGDLPRDEVAQRLGTGVWINNLWYTNFSDRSAGRITGMTRFATLWVEDGEVVAPLDVMRFDETIYRMFGSCLLGLTRERDLLLDSDTYFRRSTGSARLPGALVDGFTFTL